MSHGNLALLDRAVQGAVAHELGDGDHDAAALAELGISPTRTRTVAGLTIVSNAARDAEFDEPSAKMHDKLLRYRADRNLISDKLQRAGVPPVAVLPFVAWDRICDRTGLYRFSPRGDTVSARSDLLLGRARSELYAEANSRMNRLCLKWGAGFALLFATSLVLTISYSGYWGWGIALGVIGLIGTFIISEDGGSYSAQELQERVNAITSEHEKAGTLLEQLWPDRTEGREKSARDKCFDLQITLPPPPAEVQERLLGVERARLPLHIAVVGEAIGFKRPVADVLIRSGQVQGYQAPRIWDVLLDPIAYVIEGSAVAIIDQYGDFPIELEVMNEVINSEHLA